jgi:hypothetical protein
MRIDLWITRAGRREESRGPAGSVRAIPELSLPTIPPFYLDLVGSRERSTERAVFVVIPTAGRNP